MYKETFYKKTILRVPAKEVFQWHRRPGAFIRLVPPWESVEMLCHGGVRNDAIAVILAKLAPGIAIKWIAYHYDCIDGKQFRDIQLSGPFYHWCHTHRFNAVDDASCYLEDHIEYVLPLGFAGRLAGGRMARANLARMFTYRHEVTRRDLEMHYKYKGVSPMKVLISGSSGLVGKSLAALLTTGGHEVCRLVRKASGADDESVWDPARGEIDAASLEGIDAVIHLCGESIASGRWTKAKKQRILDSRVKSTRLLCETMAQMECPPKTFLSASAIGIYGSRGDELLDETSGVGKGFLADVCRQWEQATKAAEEKGIRVAHIRFGVVLSSAGGALATMLTPFKMGVGGVVGNGKQYMSWIALDDAIGAVHHALMDEQVSGALNVVAPNPVDNREFTKTLGKVLRRPTIFPMPAFAARLVFGEMGDELLLSSARVEPRQLATTGYEFRYPHLEGALCHLLGK